MKRILCSLLVATLPFGSVLAEAPKSKNAKVTLVYQHELPNVPGKSIKDQAFVCERRSHSGLVVEENHVLRDGLPADVQFICGEFWIGIANCQTAQDRQFRRDSQLRADDLGVP